MPYTKDQNIFCAATTERAQTPGHRRAIGPPSVRGGPRKKEQTLGTTNNKIKETKNWSLEGNRALVR